MSKRARRAARAETAVAAASWSTPPQLARIWPLYALALAIFLGAITRWELFEYDLFWQVRAGQEILARHFVQHTEEWSDTARGTPWFNFQWLFTVLVACVNKLSPGYRALPLLRSLLVAAWSFLFIRFIRIPNRGRAGEWVAPLILAPWIYFACSFRLQMRPDLVAAVLYVSLITIWLSDRSLQWKRVAGIILLVVWANFHGGTFPFGALFYSAALVFSPGDWLKKLGWIGAAGLCWFATPLGILVLKPFYENALSYDYSKSGNPDFQPFTWKLFDYHQAGWSLRLWALYCVAAAASFFAGRTRLPALYRDRRFTILVGGFLTVMTLNKIRVIHYQMIFLLPMVAAGVGALAESAVAKRSIARAAALGAAALFLWGHVAPDGIAGAKPLGDQIDDREIPIESVAFIKAHHPQGRLLNAYKFGGYLIGELPEYPVAIDGREIPFLQFRNQLNAARATTETWKQFLLDRQINLVLEDLPSMTYDPQRGFTDTHVILYPPQEWALVYFDNVSVVYLRRIPENKSIIEGSEYHFIRRGFPANFGAQFKGLPETTRLGFELEFERCLQENPRNTYCLAGKAGHQRERGNLNGAIELLQRALEIDRDDSAALLELSDLYEKTGKPELAKKCKARFDDLTIAEKTSGS